MSFEISRNSTLNMEVARNAARDVLLNFTISPVGQQPITGILKNKPKFSIEASYDRLINQDENFAFVNQLGGAFFGVQLGLTKGWTKKVYKGGSYLNVSLQGRIVYDGKSIVDVIGVTRNLVSLCSPRGFFDESTSIAQANKLKLEQDAKQAQSNNDNNGEFRAVPSGPIQKGVTLAKELGQGFANRIPPECTLEISTYFLLSGFNVTSVNFEFSHEQNKYGPLYSEVEIELSQSEIRLAKELNGTGGAFGRHKSV